MAGTIHEIDDKQLIQNIENEAESAAKEIISVAKLTKGQILVIGCSTSEALGEKLGTFSAPEAGEAIYRGISKACAAAEVYMAAQCCEHLNRAIVLEREAAVGMEIVNVVPVPKAGGSYATACYKFMKDPVLVEEIKADAGMDIGCTLIGMHLKKVAVPVRLKQNHIGKALVTAARVRPKFIGGERANYDSSLL